MASAPQVYFFQEPVPNAKGWTPDLSPAANYGAFRYVFMKEDRPYADPRAAKEKAESALSHFNPDQDFLCWPNAGDVFSIYTIIAYLTRRGFRKVRALQWQKGRHGNPGYYVPTEIPLH